MNKKISVLLVDDEQDFVTNLSRLLKNRGFEVFTAFDGLEAMERLKQQKEIDVVILDVKMPVMNGLETLFEIKDMSPETQVIMLTGHATLESGIQAIRHGAFDYLMKPCDIEDLIQKINEAYHLESIRRQPLLWPRSIVSELTRYSFSSLEPEGTLSEAIEIFNQGDEGWTDGILFIKDNQGQLHGHITKRDLMAEARLSASAANLSWQDLIDNPELLPPKSVMEVLDNRTLTTNPQEKLTNVAHLMIRNKLLSMPVLEEGKMTGVIHLRDILQYVEKEID